MILLPKLRLGITVSSGPEFMETIGRMGVKNASITSSLLNADNAGAYMEYARKANITIEAVHTDGSGNCAELAAAVGAQALCVASPDTGIIGTVSDGAKKAGLKYLIWEPSGIGIEDCRRTLAEINNSSAVPVKLALSLESPDVIERCIAVGKNAMIVIRMEDSLPMLGKAIDSLRTGGSKENLVLIDMPNADIDGVKACVENCRSFIRE
ncbi:hypothetical protein HYW32_02605 [Candidatus Berkelbacteria bacterium]|nr:hypothetical protein [Candidatus Berkelbacteria bacterium]